VHNLFPGNPYEPQARARAVAIASGASYRRLPISHLEKFQMTALHYWASPIEARLCAGYDVALVGPGNSAGRAAVYLAGYARRVFVLVRREALEASMSRYLVDRISSLGNFEVMVRTEVIASNIGTMCWRPCAGARPTERRARSRSVTCSASSAPTPIPAG
jgi:thioredoxin reductase (NADPH)